MKNQRGDSRDSGEIALKRDALSFEKTGEYAAAHERAVMTVRLTLLLLIIGIALFLLKGPASSLL